MYDQEQSSMLGDWLPLGIFFLAAVYYRDLLISGFLRLLGLV
jgi:hypothetical protein